MQHRGENVTEPIEANEMECSDPDDKPPPLVGSEDEKVADVKDPKDEVLNWDTDEEVEFDKYAKDLHAHVNGTAFMAKKRSTTGNPEAKRRKTTEAGLKRKKLKIRTYSIGTRRNHGS